MDDTKLKSGVRLVIHIVFYFDWTSNHPALRTKRTLRIWSSSRKNGSTMGIGFSPFQSSDSHSSADHNSTNGGGHSVWLYRSSLHAEI